MNKCVQKSLSEGTDLDKVEKLIQLSVKYNVNLEVGGVKVSLLPPIQEMNFQVSDEPIKIKTDQPSEEELLFYSSGE